MMKLSGPQNPALDRSRAWSAKGGLLLLWLTLASCQPMNETAQDVVEEVPAALAGSDMKLSFVETNGIRMRIAQQGNGPLVIMLHGFPELWYSWRKQLRALAEAGYRAVAPDLRGYGGTDRPPDIEDYDVLDLCGDVVGLIDALGEEQAVLIGHDWGAAVAWYCALLEPERFTGLVTMSVPWGQRASASPLELIRQQAGDNFHYMLFFYEPGLAEAELSGRTREFLQKLFATPGTPRDPPLVTDPLASAGGWIDRLGMPQTPPLWLTEEDVNYYVTEFERTGFSGGLNYYRNLDRNWELTPHIADRRIDVPTLFMAGDQEFLIAGRTQADLEEAMRLVAPQVRVEILPGGIGHWLQQEHPHSVNALLIDFLNALNR